VEFGVRTVRRSDSGMKRNTEIEFFTKPSKQRGMHRRGMAK
jgi:hypothetical protein